MKTIKYLIICILCMSYTCDGPTWWEMGQWWHGHWQNIDDPSYFFSVGQLPVGPYDIVTTQFFISTHDSIYDNFYVEELVDFSYKNKYKLVKTSDDMFLKIEEVEEERFINVYGPSKTIEELDLNVTEYMRMPDDLEPPVPDSILRQ